MSQTNFLGQCPVILNKQYLQTIIILAKESLPCLKPVRTNTVMLSFYAYRPKALRLKLPSYSTGIVFRAVTRYHSESCRLPGSFSSLGNLKAHVLLRLAELIKIGQLGCSNLSHFFLQPERTTSDLCHRYLEFPSSSFTAIPLSFCLPVDSTYS